MLHLNLGVKQCKFQNNQVWTQTSCITLVIRIMLPSSKSFLNLDWLSSHLWGHANQILRPLLGPYCKIQWFPPLGLFIFPLSDLSSPAFSIWWAATYLSKLSLDVTTFAKCLCISLSLREPAFTFWLHFIMPSSRAQGVAIIFPLTMFCLSWHPGPGYCLAHSRCSQMVFE